MPELPEVETVRRRVDGPLRDRVVHEVRQGHAKVFEAGDPQELAGMACVASRRTGKYLFLDFCDPDEATRTLTLVVHLGMSGQLTFAEPAAVEDHRFRRLPSGYQKPLGVHAEDKHTHLVLAFRDGARLLFRDPRRFGRILVLEPSMELDNPRIARLGPDALGYPLTEFVKRFMARGNARSVKSVLLDQSFLAGVGNIYADESCFTARIDPASKADALTRPKVKALGEAVAEALSRGIENAGTTFRDFVHPDGTSGHNQEDLRVYARGGLPCLRCGTILVKSTVAQRGTVHCPGCQK
ncbi:MAG: formamidopyrimidine-DNA glycosylase [Fibrobacterota bacterium]|jgi:formamidopyrimidine-DNA glycosylase